MCGIIGYSGADDFDIEKIRILYLYNALKRHSMDSSGLYTPKNGLQKSISDGPEFITDLKDSIEPDKVFVGHVRFATVGKILTTDNAHPFERGNCILVHNGTLKNHWALCHKRGINSTSINVDSDAIAACIEKDTDLSVLSEINGPAAFIIHDKRNPNRLYIFRNKERELFKGYIDGNMYISSEEKALEFIGCNNIKEFKEDHLYTIDNGSILKNPKKIDNVPYRTIHTTTSSDSISKNMEKIIDCWIRSKVTKCISYGKEVTPLNLVEGNYYLVQKIKGNDVLEVYDRVTKENFPVLKSNFNIADIIYSGNHVIFLNDVYSVGLPKELYFKEGTIAKVVDSYNNGKMDVWSEIDNSKINLHKSHVRKLTEEEKRVQTAIDLRKPLSLMRDISPFHTDKPNVDNYVPENRQDAIEFMRTLSFGNNSLVNNETIEAEEERTEEILDFEEVVEVDDFNSDDYVLKASRKELLTILPEYFSRTDHRLEQIKEATENGIMDNDTARLLLKVIGDNFLTFNKIFNKKEDA